MATWTTTPESVTKDAVAAMEMLLKTAKYSDLTIKCREYTFDVHKSIVLPRSKPLAAAIDGEFKESITMEIDLSEDEPFVVDKFLAFLYTADFNAETTELVYASRSHPVASTPKPSPAVVFHHEVDGKGVTRPIYEESDSTLTANESSPIPDSESAHDESGSPAPSTPVPKAPAEPTEPLTILAKVYVFAETFDIPALKDLARVKYANLLENSWWPNGPDFTESIRVLYENTPDSVRDIKDVASVFAWRHMKMLLERGEFREVLKDIGEIGLDMLRLSLSEPQESKNHCPKCEHYNF